MNATTNPSPAPEETSDKIIKDLLFASAPEREEELLELYKNYAAQFKLASDKPGFFMEGSSFVMFTSRTMSCLWLLAYAAKDAFEDYCGVVHIALEKGQFDPSSLNQSLRENYSSTVQHAHNLADVEEEEHFGWPEEIPHPKNLRPSDVKDAMTFDLLCLATAFIFMHEVEHVKVYNEETCLKPYDEELLCDKAARDFLLGQIAEYSKISGSPIELIEKKRAMALGLVCLFLLQMTAEENLNGSESHPSVAARIDEIIGGLPNDECDECWVYMNSILLGHVHHLGLPLERGEINSGKDFYKALLALLKSAKEQKQA